MQPEESENRPASSLRIALFLALGLILVLAISFAILASCSGGGYIYLSELNPSISTVGWGEFSVGKFAFTSANPEDNVQVGDPIVLHGDEYPHALYGHAPSLITYDLEGDYDLLQVTVGMVEWIECDDGASFVIRVDGDEQYRSDVMFASSDPVEVSIDVKDGHILDLITDEGPDGNWYCDWTIWADPILR